MINNVGIGTLDKKIDILSMQDYLNENTQLTSKKLMPLLKGIWARIEPLRGREYLEQYKDKTQDFLKITVRYRKSIRANMVADYQGQQYDIYAVIDPYMAHVKLELMCSIKQRGKNNDFR